MRMTKVHCKKDEERMVLQGEVLQDKTWNEAPWMILIQICWIMTIVIIVEVLQALAQWGTHHEGII